MSQTLILIAKIVDVYLLLDGLALVNEPDILAVPAVEARTLDVLAVDDYAVPRLAPAEEASLAGAERRPYVLGAFGAEKSPSVADELLPDGYETSRGRPHGAAKIFTIHSRKGNKKAINVNNRLELLHLLLMTSYQQNPYAGGES